MKRPVSPPEARLVELLEVIKVEGHGTEAHPLRQVTYYFRKDGTLAAYRDQLEEAPQ